MCRETKLVPAFALGKRTSEIAEALMEQLACRMHGRPKIVTDAFDPYRTAVESSFGSAVDYFHDEKRVWQRDRLGEADPRPGQGIRGVSTSMIERQNLTVRNFVRRLARKTLCFSKKLENLWASLSLYFCWYDFGRIHGTLRCTPAMAAGLSRDVWDVGRLVP